MEKSLKPIVVFSFTNSATYTKIPQFQKEYEIFLAFI